jgi:hypothetical protein
MTDPRTPRTEPRTVAGKAAVMTAYPPDMQGVNNRRLALRVLVAKAEEEAAIEAEASTLASSERLAAALRDMVVANLGSPDKFDPGDLMSGLPSVEELAAEIVRHLPALSDPDAERQRAIAALDDGRRHHAVRDHEPMWACDGCVPTAVKHELTRAAALPAAQERQRAIGEDRAVRLLHAIREALDVFDAGRDGFDAVLRAALRHDERTRGERIDPMVEQFRA